MHDCIFQRDLANGGTGSHADTDLPSGTVYTILSPEAAGISRPGYTFTGWNTEPDGSGTAYQPSDTTVITGDVILYAQWTPNEVPVIPCQCFCIPCCHPCCPCTRKGGLYGGNHKRA
ncbi:MAG: InlB B-repeat-containing protein [Oscillospiraceae bacterium]|nr:InlB B-repeat-containing protein [Oscillospiraceae bacterium]